MNQTSDSDIERLLAEHGPRRPPAFAVLHPLAEFIRLLRKRGASFETVRGILRAQSTDVSASTIRRFCCKVLGEDPAIPRKNGHRLKRAPISIRPSEATGDVAQAPSQSQDVNVPGPLPAPSPSPSIQLRRLRPASAVSGVRSSAHAPLQPWLGKPSGWRLTARRETLNHFLAAGGFVGFVLAPASRSCEALATISTKFRVGRFSAPWAERAVRLVTISRTEL